MRIATEQDVPFINSILNHPRVRPHVWFGEEKLDASESIHLMWTLVAEDGVMMAEALGDGNYLALVAFHPRAWGASAVNSMRQAIKKIFTETDCNRLYGSVKTNNPRAARNLIGMGLKNVGVNGNRITGYIDYLDVLDESMFEETAKAGWSGKALYFWNIKAKLEDIQPFIPLDPIRPIYAKDGVVYDFS